MYRTVSQIYTTNSLKIDLILLNLLWYQLEIRYLSKLRIRIGH